MLNECEIVEARELAKELVEANRVKDRESLIRAFQGVKNKLLEIWNSIKEGINNIYETRAEVEQENILRESWHVPIKLILPKTPYVKNHNLQLARNKI